MYMWHWYCSYITLSALNFEASLLITEEEMRSLTRTLEETKAAVLHQSSEVILFVQAPCAQSTPDWSHVTLYVLWPVKLAQLCITLLLRLNDLKPFHRLVIAGHINLMVAHLGWTWDVHIFSSLRDRDPIAMGRVNYYGCVMAGDGRASSLRLMKYSNAQSVRMCEAGKAWAY